MIVLCILEHPNAVYDGLREGKAAGVKIYVREIIEERKEDENGKTTDEVGVIIVIYSTDLLRQSVRLTNFGCHDGTFNFVSKRSDNLNFELVSIITQDTLNKKFFALFRMISSRKSFASRKEAIPR